MDTIQSIGYPVYFKDSIQELVRFIQAGHYSRFFVLTDENTAQYCLPKLRQSIDNLDNFDIIEINAGEESKDIDFCIGIWKMLIDFGADRKSLLINLGGGVISDMGGFVASTYKRGIDFVHVPTTLLSQVDASVGGKTGIDIDSIKNIVGTFTPPKAVFIDNSFISTLPARQKLAGMAEMLKHGLIADAVYWHQLKGISPEELTPDMIYRSVQIKNEVVVADPNEKGIRKSLNFGHTIGHAVEGYSLKNDDNPLTHGEAIAIGMICEAWLSTKKAGLSEGELNEIVQVLLSKYPAYKLESSCHGLLHTLMQKDKKNDGSNINCTLISAIGKCAIDNICTEEELCDSLNYYSSLVD